MITRGILSGENGIVTGIETFILVLVEAEAEAGAGSEGDLDLVHALLDSAENGLFHLDTGETIGRQHAVQEDPGQGM